MNIFYAKCTHYAFPASLFYKEQPVSLFFYTIFTKLVKYIDSTS